MINTNTKSSYIEVPTITKRGKVIWIGQNINIYSENEKPKEVIIVGINLSEQKETEKIIYNTNKFPEENPNPVLRFSSKGQVLMYSNKAGGEVIRFLDKNHEVRENFLLNLKKIYQKE